MSMVVRTDCASAGEILSRLLMHKEI